MMMMRLVAAGVRWSHPAPFFSLFFTLVTGLRRFLNLELSDTGVYETQTRARLGTTAHFCTRLSRQRLPAAPVGIHTHAG